MDGERWYYFVQPFDTQCNPVHCFMERQDIIRSWLDTHPKLDGLTDDDIVEEFCVIHWATECKEPNWPCK